jgi:hypothetical protein
MESNWIQSALRPLIGPLWHTAVIMVMEKLVEWWLAGKTEVLEENLPHATFVHHKISHDQTGVWTLEAGDFFFIIIIWFVRLLALRPLLAYCGSLGW